MKRLFGCGFFLSVILMSCTSKDVSTPKPSFEAFYQDNNIDVQALVPVQTSSTNVSVSFSTLYLKNIVRVEVMSSNDVNTFCTSSALSVSDTITSLTTFTLGENTIKGSDMYFMLRFKDKEGNWKYTNYKNLQIR